MKILVDADACPVLSCIEKQAKAREIELIFVCDSNHMLKSDYAQIIQVESGHDSADFALIGMCKENDIVVTNDYGLAALVLGKKARALHASGMIYTKENIDALLLERHLTKLQRQATGRRRIKKQHIYIEEHSMGFKDALNKIIDEITKEQNDEQES
ncbi:MAG: hypothetical protein E7252_03055 [Lachnospira sp.]|nr:hypothetical protein [Lachnospira sp.]